MSEPLRTVTLKNGLDLRFIDATTHYYGGFYRVAVEVECSIPLQPTICPAGIDFQDLLALLGDIVRYRQLLQRMGVRDSEVESTRQQLIEKFMANNSGYLSSPEFPSRLVISEIKKLKDRRKAINSRFSPK